YGGKLSVHLIDIKTNTNETFKFFSRSAYFKSHEKYFSGSDYNRAGFARICTAKLSALRWSAMDGCRDFQYPRLGNGIPGSNGYGQNRDRRNYDQSHSISEAAASGQNTEKRQELNG